MIGRGPTILRSLAMAVPFALLTVATALAQQPSQPPAQPAAKAPPSKQAPAAGKGGSSEGAPAGEGGLRQRVEQLEEQLVDMQVMVGTLESLAKSGGAAAQANRGAPSSGGSGADSARIDALEVQIRALTSQVEQLSNEVRASRGRSGAAPADAAGGPRPQVGGFTQQAPPSAPSPPGTFGTVAVSPGTPGTPGGRDQIGQIIGGGNDGAAQGDAKALYEAAYGNLLQQDYAAAEAGFEDFLRRFPNDPLAGNAQYWLGESHYVRGQYKQAAGAFLKGSQTYAKSSKAPDSLLKLGMSLDRLGQKDAACSSFGELSSKYPSAPAQLRDRANRERQRIGCG